MTGLSANSAAHICLVSDQLPPNLIPALMLRPHTVHLVVTEGMKEQGVRLDRILRDQGFGTKLHAQAPSTGLAAIREFAEELAVRLDGQGPFILNVTGGTKLMALAFTQVLPELLRDVDVLYTDTEHQVLEFLSDKDKAPVPIASVLSLDLHLRAYGLLRRNTQSEDEAWLAGAQKLKPLTKWLALHAGAIEGFIGALNSAAEQAVGRQDDPFRACQKLEARGRGVAALEEIGKPEYELMTRVSSDTVKFASRDAARFLGGGWMEHYAWWILRDAGVEKADAGMQVGWQGGDKQRPPPNELDVVAVHRNRLLLIECKTARFGKNVVKDQEILNRLESLGRNAGGLFGTRVLLSARRLPDELQSRAKAYRLTWFDCTNLKDFKPFIESWIKH